MAEEQDETLRDTTAGSIICVDFSFKKKKTYEEEGRGYEYKTASGHNCPPSQASKKRNERRFTHEIVKFLKWQPAVERHHLSVGNF